MSLQVFVEFILHLVSECEAVQNAWLGFQARNICSITYATYIVQHKLWWQIMIMLSNWNFWNFWKSENLLSETGWFAGRGLAISQVTTKYFIWMDDDLRVTENTNLEKLLEIIEDLNFDLIGAMFENSWFQSRKSLSNIYPTYIKHMSNILVLKP